MNRMAGKWYGGFQNPVAPVILSKAPIEIFKQVQGQGH